jgi:ribosomal 50S subunit-recycling heat shock protein
VLRLDLFLKKICLVRQRSVAKEICEAGAVQINGRRAKPAQDVDTGDVVRVRLAHRDLELRVVAVPHGNIAKREVFRYVDVLRDDTLDPLSENQSPESTG